MTDNLQIAMAAINKWLYFGWNFQVQDYTYELADGTVRHEVLPRFLMEAKWTCNKQHMIGKWKRACDCNAADTNAYTARFYADLDIGNRKAMLDWVINNYNLERKLFNE